jgi:hypothetical protein
MEMSEMPPQTAQEGAIRDEGPYENREKLYCTNVLILVHSPRGFDKRYVVRVPEERR